MNQRNVALQRWLLLLALLCMAFGSVGVAVTQTDAGNAENESGSTTEPPAAPAAPPPPDSEAALRREADRTTSKFAVTIRKPSGPPRIATDLVDLHGNAITVACSSCHATRQPNAQNKSVTDLDEFHVGMSFSHGAISCLSCHNDRDYDALKLADGSRVEFSDVMTLCAQCHGPQMIAYEHGAHGGMTGYWDLTRGPRAKNNCIDCHNPHAPQFPKMRPTFKPRDRFLDRRRTEH